MLQYFVKFYSKRTIFNAKLKVIFLRFILMMIDTNFKEYSESIENRSLIYELITEYRSWYL